MIKNKRHTALEFLIIYGLAVMVLLVVLVSLSYSDALNQEPGLSSVAGAVIGATNYIASNPIYALLVLTLMVFGVRKAQAAMEFLMTYGWAILVVLVTIGALVYFGVLSPDRFLPATCRLPSGIACNDFILDHDAGGSPGLGGITVVLRNGLGFDIGGSVANNFRISVSACNVDYTSTDTIVLANGEEGTFYFGNGGAGNCNLGSLGSRFSDDIFITYINVNTGLAHTMQGTLRGKVE